MKSQKNIILSIHINLKTTTKTFNRKHISKNNYSSTFLPDLRWCPKYVLSHSFGYNPFLCLLLNSGDALLKTTRRCKTDL